MYVGLFPGAGVRLVRRRPNLRQLDLLRRGHPSGHRGEGGPAPPRCARRDVHHRAQDALAARAAQEEVPDVVGPGDSFRSRKAQVRKKRTCGTVL